MSLLDLVAQAGDRRHGGRKHDMTFPRSLVKVLQSEAELHEAIAHAIEFERDVAALTSARVSRYEQLDTPGKLLTPGSGETARELMAAPQAKTG